MNHACRTTHSETSVNCIVLPHYWSFSLLQSADPDRSGLIQ